jgi:hypothetical protein
VCLDLNLALILIASPGPETRTRTWTHEAPQAQDLIPDPWTVAL